MPLSHARRPLVLATVSYALLLALLRCWGAFEPAAAEGRARRATEATIAGVVVSPCVETRRGDRLLVEGQGGKPAGRRVEAYLPRGSCDAIRPLPGQQLSLQGRLRSPRRSLMPGDFDEAGLLEAKDVWWVLHARRAEVTGAAVPLAFLLAAWAERAHGSAHRAFRRWLAPDDARLLEGLLFGYKGSLDPVVQRQAQDAGVIHLLVPSGAKVGFVVWGLAWALGAAGLRRPWGVALPAAAGAFYCLMVGGESPYLRAYAAALAGLAAGFWPRRDAGGLQAIALSALLLLILWPRMLFQAGFQMTYAAALALWLSARRWRPAGRGWLRGGLRVLAISLAVQLALWPILINVFGRASIAGLLANVLLVPAAGAYMAGGLLLWTFAGFPAAAGATAGALAWALSAFKAVCAFFAALPFATVDPLPMSVGAVVVWYLACGALFVLPEVKPASRLAAAAAAVWGLQSAVAWAAGPRLELCFMGDRRGYAVAASLPGGEHILVDAGLAPARLTGALRALGARPVDALFFSGQGRESRRGVRIADRWPVLRLSQGPGEFRFGDVAVRAGSGRDGRAPVEMSFGRIRLSFGRTPGVATLARSGAPTRGSGAPTRGSEVGPVEFCILEYPAAIAPAECAPAGIRGVGVEGAVWIITDGDHYQVASSASGRPLGRALL